MGDVFEARSTLKEEFGPRIDLAWDERVTVIFKVREGEDPLGATEHLLKFLAEL